MGLVVLIFFVKLFIKVDRIEKQHSKDHPG